MRIRDLLGVRVQNLIQGDINMSSVTSLSRVIINRYNYDQLTMFIHHNKTTREVSENYRVARVSSTYQIHIVDRHDRASHMPQSELFRLFQAPKEGPDFHRTRPPYMQSCDGTWRRKEGSECKNYIRRHKTRRKYIYLNFVGTYLNTLWFDLWDAL